MDTIAAVLGGVLVGALVAALIAAGWWGRKLKSSAERVSRLEQARQQGEQANTQLRKQFDQMRIEVAELRHQADRQRARRDTVPTPVDETPDLLLREAPVEEFPATMILPRKAPAAASGTAADEPFPATMMVPRKPPPSSS